MKDAYGVAGRSGRSHRNALSGLTANEINVQAAFKVSQARQPQTNDDQSSFVQLGEIGGDTKSAASGYS